MNTHPIPKARPLKAGKTFTGDPQPRFLKPNVSRISLYSISDTAGRLFVEESSDQKTWTEVFSKTTEANRVVKTDPIVLSDLFYRICFENTSEVDQNMLYIYREIPSPFVSSGGGGEIGDIIVNPPEVTVQPPEVVVHPPEITVNPPEVVVNPPEVVVNQPDVNVTVPDVVVPPPTVVPTNQAYQDHVSIEDMAGVGDATFSFAVDKIIRLSNDGESDIIFNFDRPTTDPGAFTLKAGETQEFIPRKCSNLHVRSSSDSQPFRAWGLVE